ncbi:MAG: FtsQ-type POTRA domain-containing protein [Thermodesulfobacterium sp.]|nr:FtsQ-type POTRA domain-containing protein [Thermodesulfobacterium sp.]
MPTVTGKIKYLIKNRLLWILTAVLFSLILIIYLLYFTDLFILKEVRVINNKKVGKKEIIALTGLKGGERLFSIPIDKIKKRILLNPKIEKVVIAKRLPYTLEIKIKEREPLAIITVDNKGYLIDKN